MVGGLAHFAIGTRSEVIAEGIETPAELDMLRTLGVPLGQGYLLGRPSPAGTWATADAGSLGYLIAEGSTRDRWYRLGPKVLDAPAPGEPADPREPLPRV
jgi:predicted signal transduction protein with EAL and GGDEF domain